MSDPTAQIAITVTQHGASLLAQADGHLIHQEMPVIKVLRQVKDGITTFIFVCGPPTKEEVFPLDQ